MPTDQLSARSVLLLGRCYQDWFERRPDALSDFLFENGYSEGLSRALTHAAMQYQLKDAFVDAYRNRHKHGTGDAEFDDMFRDRDRALSSAAERALCSVFPRLAKDMLNSLSAIRRQFGAAASVPADVLVELNSMPCQLIDELQRSLELDGYEYDGTRLRRPDSVVDAAGEAGYLEALYMSLGLGDADVTFHFLRGADGDYLAGKYENAIGNSRQFLENTLIQIAIAAGGANELGPKREAVRVREVLADKGILDTAEKEFFAKAYGMLSNRGSHPRIAERDEALFWHKQALILTQFALLRYKTTIPR
jgi:hypothetical protein